MFKRSQKKYCEHVQIPKEVKRSIAKMFRKASQKCKEK